MRPHIAPANSAGAFSARFSSFQFRADRQHPRTDVQIDGVSKSGDTPAFGKGRVGCIDVAPCMCCRNVFKETARMVSLGRRPLPHWLRRSPRQAPPTSSQFYSKRLPGNERASRISAARRPGWKRPAALSPLEFLKLLVLFEAGIVIFPPGPRTAPSSRASNCSVLLTLITVPVVFLLVVPLPLDVTVVLDVAVAAVAGGSLNAGALLSGSGSFAPAPANVPVVEPLPPEPV